MAAASCEGGGTAAASRRERDTIRGCLRIGADVWVLKSCWVGFAGEGCHSHGAGVLMVGGWCVCVIVVSSVWAGEDFCFVLRLHKLYSIMRMECCLYRQTVLNINLFS